MLDGEYHQLDGIQRTETDIVVLPVPPADKQTAIDPPLTRPDPPAGLLCPSRGCSNCSEFLIVEPDFGIFAPLAINVIEDGTIWADLGWLGSILIPVPPEAAPRMEPVPAIEPALEVSATNPGAALARYPIVPAAPARLAAMSRPGCARSSRACRGCGSSGFASSLR